jgi:hypothetical protein
MSKAIKTSLGCFALGLFLCANAIGYMKAFSETGSQLVFSTMYVAGVILAASGAARATFIPIFQAIPRFKLPIALLSGSVVFAGVAAGLVSPFFMLK